MALQLSANSADTPAEQTEQRVVRQAVTQRAVTYARSHGVLPIAALGNEATDLGHPTSDATSPDFPPGRRQAPDVDNSCITVPTETRGVVAVSSTGPARARRTTRTGAPSRPTSRLPVVTPTTP